MAFDTSTRNRLNKFVSDARTLLTGEFTNQCQVDYGLDPDTGAVADLDRLGHLDDARRQTAIILRETLAHYYANLPTKNKKQTTDHQALITRIIREQAFTILNRLCAIRMAEARDLVVQSVGAGVQSQGFQLYQYVVGHSLGDTGAAYQQYMFSLFDEFAVDLSVLFDRFSPSGRLFPRETVLTQLIGLINDPEINHLWAEDETIGWIYQYFNSKEERKAMRDASQAPRNSRELAVRNQFFTPRYVVEFLTDNTLGRIWYEMRKGVTRLKDECQYLVRRPNEIFLTEGESEPTALAAGSEPTDAPPEKDFTQEELLNQPVHIPHRPLKDPREIRMLDPACGSMHFGLYAFDLYLKIYEEYWDLVSGGQLVVGSDGTHHYLLPSGQKTLPTTHYQLTTSHQSKEAYLREVPKLIIEHNIHGIDIDPRAVQIAGLSLWLRAQRAWKSQGLAAGERPQVTRSNVVCAEPMPGDKQQLEAFCKTLHPAIAQMVTAIFEEMKLAGEAGSLLKIEQEISSLVAAAKKQWQTQPKEKQLELFGGASVVKEQQLEFDLSGITDELFFEKAEEEIYSALEKYASESSTEGFRRKLFANDAEKGFALVEVCQRKFDVVLMNPPFGDPVVKTKPYLLRSYPTGAGEVYSAFALRACELLRDQGMVGMLSSRTFLFKTEWKDWRAEIVGRGYSVFALADLGNGVLDDAIVEATATVLVDCPEITGTFLNALSQNDKAAFLRNCIPWSPLAFVRKVTDFDSISGKPWVYSIPDSVLSDYKSLTFGSEFGRAKSGVCTGDDFRFLRLFWEVGVENISPTGFIPFSKGGEYFPIVDRVHLLLDWRNKGRDMRLLKGARVQGVDNFFSSGVTYPLRTFSALAGRFLPGGVVTSNLSQFIPLESEEDAAWCIACLGSRYFQSNIEMLIGSGDATTSGGTARSFAAAPVAAVPYSSEWSDETKTKVLESVRDIYDGALVICTLDETSPWFSGFGLSAKHEDPLLEFWIREFRAKLEMLERYRDIENAMSVDTGDSMTAWSESLIGPSKWDYSNQDTEQDSINLYATKTQDYMDVALVRNISLGPHITRKSFQADRKVEVISHLLEVPPESVAMSLLNSSPDNAYLQSRAKEVVSALVGIAIGRWKQTVLEDKIDIGRFSPFSRIPTSQPAQLSVDDARTMLVEDSTSECDISNAVMDALNKFGNVSESVLAQAGISDLREWISRDYFEYHLGLYSRSRRNAPIYWPISTESCSYTLWFYYHRLTDQTLYQAVNDFVDPKLKGTVRQLADLRAIKYRSSAQENELAQLTELESELEQFKADLLEIAAFWKPNLNDGVQITAAPLHKFFRHNAWRKKLKTTWDELQAAKYDWAHLALSIWPDRVIKVAARKDRSIAIAHDLEDHLWHEVEIKKTSKTGKVTTKLEWQPKKLTEAELDTIVELVKSGKWPVASDRKPVVSGQSVGG